MTQYDVIALRSYRLIKNAIDFEKYSDYKDRIKAMVECGYLDDYNQEVTDYEHGMALAKNYKLVYTQTYMESCEQVAQWPEGVEILAYTEIYAGYVGTSQQCRLVGIAAKAIKSNVAKVA